ncbi:cytochrome P450 [Apiospora sp. TS-2023a]
MTWLTILSTAGVLLSTALGYFFRCLYIHRRKINELRKRGVPMPEGWSWVTGHLLVLQKYVERMPPGANVMFATRDMCQELCADTEVIFMDIWPAYSAHYIVSGPGPSSQICKDNLPKTAIMSRLMRQVTGGPDMLTMNGNDWKYCRSLFNPGFSTGAMSNNVPHIVDSMLVFRQKLIDTIGKGMIRLDDFTNQLTAEIILKVTLDDDSSYQRFPNALVTALRRILSWHSFWDPRILLNPLRPLVQAYNSRIVNNYIRKELDRRYQELKDAKVVDGIETNSKAIKSATTLALEAYLGDANTSSQKDVLNDEFADMLASQIRLFLFAGTDSTATVLVYLYHMLSKHPDQLATLRKEHDEVFGQNPDDASHRLKQKPSLLNNCPLTVAFIKETLRLYSPGGTMRSGHPDDTITDLQGVAHPLLDFYVHILHSSVHTNPRVWPLPKKFLPERFLVEPGHELYPSDPAAYRPFEQGPRNCIGQTLVWNELKIALILTCRDIKITDAYEEFDALKESEMGGFARLQRRVFGEPSRITTLDGDRAYQTDTPGGHPVDGYPCRVEWANSKF